MKIQVQNQSQEKRDAIHIEFSFAEQTPELVDTPYGVVVKLADCAATGELGGPALPSRVVRVALPPFTRATTVEGTAKESRLLSATSVMPAPLQAPRPGVIEDAAHKLESPELMNAEVFSHKASSLLPPKAKPFTNLPAPAFIPPKEALYANEFRSPRPPVQLLRQEDVGLQPVALIQLNPIQLNADGLLVFHESIDLTVCFESLSTPAALAKPDAEGELRTPFWRTVPSRHHAQRLLDRLRAQVINGDWVWDFSQLFSDTIQVEYLIITDDQSWDESNMVPTGHAGDLVANFERLIGWKQERGLKARLVTISEIVAGDFGDFKTGARDLQEVIRNFLKWAYGHWGISWLLLGGDINILPVRRVAGGIEGHINPADNDPPDANQSYWTGSFLKMHAVNPGLWWPGSSIHHKLVNPENGMAFIFDPTGNLAPLARTWHFTTDDTYTTLTNAPTEFVRVNAPEADANVRLQWLYHWNTIPTDLYYASLTGAEYDQPNRHDWDLLNNGIYGQHTNNDDYDGVDFSTDISVGRAPVANTDQAAAFVDKVIAYEKLKTPEGEQLDWDWPRRLLLVSSNWGERAHVYPSVNNPPTDGNTYHHTAGSNRSLIRLAQAPDDLEWRLFSKLLGSSRAPIIPFDRDAAISAEGWYFAVSDTDLTPNEIVVFGIRLALPSQWVVVYAAADEISPEYFIFDRTTAELSMRDQEQLRRQITSDQPRINWVSRLYEDEIDLSPKAKEACDYAPLAAESLRAALNYGQHIVSLSGHGTPGGCCFLDSLMAQDLHNGYHSFIGYADSCLTAAYDEEDAAGEHLVNNPLGGSVAYVGNSRFSWIGLGDNFQRKFFKTLNSTQHLGLLNDSRCELVFHNTGAPRLYNKWVAFSLNLLGDPEMPIWIGTPRPFTGRYLGNRNHMEVHDLENETKRCQIDEIIRANHAEVFDSDTLEQAHEEHYDNCAFCIGDSKR